MRLVTFLALLLLNYWAQGQALSLDDILNIRTMDSTTLRRFASEKGYKLKEIERDVWRAVHKYYSTADNTISFERTFPTGKKLFEEVDITKDYSMVYYHFTGKETHNDFRKKIKEKGFRFKRTDTDDFGGSIFTHNIFVKKDTEIDLASEKFRERETEYTLMYYGRIN